MKMMMNPIVVLCMVVVAVSATSVVAFTTPSASKSIRIDHRSTTGMIGPLGVTSNHAPLSTDKDDDVDEVQVVVSRRSMIHQSIIATASIASSVFVWTPSSPAVAAVTGANKVNAKLASFGLPKISDIPDGYVPLLEIYGKGKNRSPLLVTFNHPLSWVVTLPSNNNNGEDGTIQVGDYGKGDTATLFVDDSATSAAPLSKATIEEGLRKCISQRGSNMYQSFKLLQVTDGPTVDGQSYQIAEFKYQLITGAGFEVDRKGIASVTKSNSKQMEIFWAASIDARYKKTADTLRNIVTSFRCYASGLNFSDEIIA